MASTSHGSKSTTHERAASAAPSVTPPPSVESFANNGDQTLIDFSRDFNRSDWTNLMSANVLAAAQAQLMGNSEQMYGYTRYAYLIGTRLGVWGQTAGVSDSSPPARVRTAGAS